MSNHQALLEALPLVPWEADVESGRIRFVGPQAADYLGYPIEGWLSPTFWEDRLFPDDQVAFMAARARLLADGGSHIIDYRMEHSRGHVVWTCETATVESSAGRPLVRGFLVDITNRKRQEVSLWKREERVRTLLRRAPDALVLTDADGLIVNMNDQAEALLDYRPAEVVGSSIDHLVPNRLKGRFPELRAAFDRDPERRSLIDGHGFAVLRSDGTEVPVELSMSPILGVDDSRQILCSLRDLTARRRAEWLLRTSERRLREIANVFPAMVCFVDGEQRYRFVNDAYARWYGSGQRQMEGRLVREVLGERAYEPLMRPIEAALGGNATRFRADIKAPDGRELPVEMSLVPQQDESGPISGFYIVTFDMTEEIATKEADQRHRAELAHVARVATMGELAAFIAHELNQPLSAIVTNAQAARRFLTEGPTSIAELQAALDDIAADGRRAGDVITSMRQLLRRSVPRQEPIHLGLVVREVSEMLRGEAIGRGVELLADPPPDQLPVIIGDPIQMKQVVLNLLMNGIEAASRASAGRRTVGVSSRNVDGHVEVVVHDTGPGLLTSDPEELFAPFVSRKPDGLGMGLTISRTIVEAHDGKVWGEPNVPHGATFIVRIPAA